MKRRLSAPTLLRAWLLATLLLAAQAAGLAHRVLHAPGGPTGAGAAQGMSAASWGGTHEPGSADCRLVDQLAHADLLCGAAAALHLPPPAAAAVAAVLPQALPARPVAAYLARAPPRG